MFFNGDILKLDEEKREMWMVIKNVDFVSW